MNSERMLDLLMIGTVGGAAFGAGGGAVIAGPFGAAVLGFVGSAIGGVTCLAIGFAVSEVAGRVADTLDARRNDREFDRQLRDLTDAANRDEQAEGGTVVNLRYPPAVTAADMIRGMDGRPPFAG